MTQGEIHPLYCKLCINFGLSAIRFVFTTICYHYLVITEYYVVIILFFHIKPSEH